MARNKYYKYRVTTDCKLPKKGFIRMDENDPNVAIYDRLLKMRDISRCKLDDLNTDVKKLTKYRVPANIKQTELAKMSGISIKTIQSWEFYGMSGAALGKAVKVADILGVKDLRDLLEDN